MTLVIMEVLVKVDLRDVQICRKAAQIKPVGLVIEVTGTRIDMRSVSMDGLLKNPLGRAKS